MRARAAVSAAVLGTVFAFSGVASAQATKPATPAAKPADKPVKPLTDPQKKEAARKAFKEGETRYKANDYAGALEQFQRADSLFPLPASMFEIAVCQDRLNKVVEAVAAYQTFLDGKPDAKKMADQITEAQKRLEALKKTPATLQIAVAPITAPHLLVSIDGAPGTPPAPNQTSTGYAVPPGHHKILITADGFNPLAAELDVGFAETKDVPLGLVAIAPPPAPVPPPDLVAPMPSTQPVAPPPPPPPPFSKTPAIACFAGAGAGVVLGTVFGILSLSAKSKFSDGTKTTDQADKVDSFALASDISFAAALTLGIAGGVLYMRSNEAPATALNVSPKKPGPRAFISPYGGATGGGARAFVQF